MCSPLLRPQIVGMVPSGTVAVKVSRHSSASAVMAEFSTVSTGPRMLKVSKSRRRVQTSARERRRNVDEK